MGTAHRLGLSARIAKQRLGVPANTAPGAKSPRATSLAWAHARHGPASIPSRASAIPACALFVCQQATCRRQMTPGGFVVVVVFLKSGVCREKPKYLSPHSSCTKGLGMPCGDQGLVGNEGIWVREGGLRCHPSTPTAPRLPGSSPAAPRAPLFIHRHVCEQHPAASSLQNNWTKVKSHKNFPLSEEGSSKQARGW